MIAITISLLVDFGLMVSTVYATEMEEGQMPRLTHGYCNAYVARWAASH